MADQPLIQIKDLSVEFRTEDELVRAVKNISFDIPLGKTVGVVGESGSGKSVTALSILGLIPNPPGKVTSGEILFEGKNLFDLSSSEMCKIRGNHISMIFQEPMTSLNPVFSVGNQLMETIRLHQGLNKKEALEKSIHLLDEVGIPDPKARIVSYPHQLSGGQRQRVMIAMAIACEPKLLIADEPTTALDVTIQKQILELMAKLQEQYKMSVMFITHDLGVIGDIADELVVMYRGDIVEKGRTAPIFKSPQHPYTKGLLACRPTVVRHPSRLPTLDNFMTEDGNEKEFDITSIPEKKMRPLPTDETPLIEIKNLKKYFPLKGGIFNRTHSWVKAVDDVSIKVFKGRTLGLVGESGCGKTTLGRTLVRLIEPTGGELYYDNNEIGGLTLNEFHPYRKNMQIIFQDPYASLNPRMMVGNAIQEPLEIHGIGQSKKERKERVLELLNKVGLPSSVYSRYPHEFSGGQRQRISIARALAVNPNFIVCDESVSALDVSIQAQILNLLLDLQEDMGLTYIFISHDLAVVKMISDEVAVMYEGKIVEESDSKSIYESPQHDYTKKLLSAIPTGIPKELAEIADRRQ